MKETTEAQLAEAARGVAGDDELAARFAILAGVNENEILQRGFQKGVEEGIEKGVETGVVQGEQRNIWFFLESRLPVLASTSLGHLSSSAEADADALLKKLFGATTGVQARLALSGGS